VSSWAQLWKRRMFVRFKTRFYLWKIWFLSLGLAYQCRATWEIMSAVFIKRSCFNFEKKRTNFGQHENQWVQLWKTFGFYHTQNTIVGLKTFSKAWFLALKWRWQYWSKCDLMGAILKIVLFITLKRNDLFLHKSFFWSVYHNKEISWCFSKLRN